jgi:hypothetical protein
VHKNAFFPASVRDNPDSAPVLSVFHNEHRAVALHSIVYVWIPSRTVVHTYVTEHQCSRRGGGGAVVTVVVVVVVVVTVVVVARWDEVGLLVVVRRSICAV